MTCKCPATLMHVYGYALRNANVYVQWSVLGYLAHARTKGTYQCNNGYALHYFLHVTLVSTLCYVSLPGLLLAVKDKCLPTSM